MFDKPKTIARSVLSLTCLTLLALATSCANKEKDDNAVEIIGTIGTTCMDLTNPYFKLIANVMTEEAAKHGYKIVALDGALNSAKQNDQLNDFAAQKVDAVFLNPVNSDAAGEGVKKLHAAGIPVFTFDIQITDPEAVNLVTAHVGSDNRQGGVLAGKSMIEALGNKGKVAIIGYPEVSSCILRVEGFKAALKEADSAIEIVSELDGKGARNTGFSVATDILQTHEDLDGIFAINDPSALGAHAAVAKANRTDAITIVAFDASPDGKKGVAEGKLYDTPEQFPKQMALDTLNNFLNYLEGEEPPKVKLIPCAHYRAQEAAK